MAEVYPCVVCGADEDGGGLCIPHMYDEQLNQLAQGCTEITCPQHGAYNLERHKRGIRV